MMPVVLRRALLGALAGPAAGLWLAVAAAAQTPQPAAPQPADAELEGGLAVVYFFNDFRHVNEILEWQDYRDGKAGPPVPRLDYNVGVGEVLTSGETDGVGAEITGLIRLDTPGTYAFAAQSNDGVRLEIGGVPVLEDPDVHADRFSEIVQVQIGEAGWYPIKILYFERKNTSTLELYWQPPSDESATMPLVPAEVLAHRTGS